MEWYNIFNFEYLLVAMAATTWEYTYCRYHISTKSKPPHSPSSPTSIEPNFNFVAQLLVKLAYSAMLNIFQITRTVIKKQWMSAVGTLYPSRRGVHTWPNLGMGYRTCSARSESSWCCISTRTRGQSLHWYTPTIWCSHSYFMNISKILLECHFGRDFFNVILHIFGVVVMQRAEGLGINRSWSGCQCMFSHWLSSLFPLLLLEMRHKNAQWVVRKWGCLLGKPYGEFYLAGFLLSPPPVPMFIEDVTS